MKTHPTDYDYVGTVMTNFDHSIDEDLAKKLKRRKWYSQYAAWDFCGYVWWDRKTKDWNCEVWSYHVHRETVSANSLQEIMDKVSEDYGYD